MRLLCQRVNVFAVLRDTVKLFFMRLNQFAFLPAMYENACFPTVLSTKWLSNFWVFINMIGENIYLGSFSLHFSYCEIWWVFCVLNGHVNFLFCDSLPICMHFKAWITGFFFFLSHLRDSFFFVCNMSYKCFPILSFVF